MKKMKTTKSKIKELVKNEEAVSPVIGVILMIAITVVIAAVVASFAYGIIGGVAKAPNSALVIEDARVDNIEIAVIHHGGDTIVDAFTVNDTLKLATWDNLKVKHGGIDIPEANVTVGGNNDTNFVSGEQLQINVSALASGDTITVVYTETGDLLQRVKVA
ncbi:MAG: type IV pilin N-terminal domain-containing protein [Euryarchaeota archaeon]|nr:type IV pilin N-terminal domain-containing protein [Euryarchaeota archaeon]